MTEEWENIGTYYGLLCRNLCRIFYWEGGWLSAEEVREFSWSRQIETGNSQFWPRYGWVFISNIMVRVLMEEVDGKQKA